jgi:hypothetical protein
MKPTAEKLSQIRKAHPYLNAVGMVDKVNI